MVTFLLAIIYIAFISLGLPDSLLGAAWPVMRVDFNVPLSYAGIASMIMTCSTVISSLLSNKNTHKFGAGPVTAFSVGLTAISLIAISFAPSFVFVCLWSVPYGLGAGGVDAALNNYVAINFKARHMSWLHCFWGIGASFSPYIMAHFLTTTSGWSGGYKAVGFIQIILTIVLFISLPFWKHVDRSVINNKDEVLTSLREVHLSSALKIKGVPFVLLAFFCYCGLETTTGLWASSYLVNYKGISVEIAARFASLFYLGITAGRFICGFLAEKLGDKKLIRTGSFIIVAGILMVLLSSSLDQVALVGLIVIGFGCAPVYPSIIHSTPFNFGKENSQVIVGIQMASAYLGSTFMPPLFGVLSSKLSIAIYPIYLLLITILMIVGSEMLNRTLASESKK